MISLKVARVNGEDGERRISDRTAPLILVFLRFFHSPMRLYEGLSVCSGILGLRYVSLTRDYGPSSKLSGHERFIVMAIFYLQRT